MAPAILLHLSPLPSFPSTLRNPNPNPHLSFTRRHSSITCRAPDPQSTSPPPSTALEAPGAGAATPTRGELFLEHHHAKVAERLQIKKGDKSNTKKKSKPDAKASPTVTACCYGCGAPLQIEEIDAPGYVDVETYELKKKHRQLRTVLCGRCKLLSHGHMVTAVGGNGGYPGGKQFVTAEELREKLSHLRNEKVLIVKLVDIVDFSGSFLARIRDLAGANPIILVITKIDLLPKGTDLNCIGDWVVEAATKKKLNVISVHLTSSKSMVGIVGVISEIQKEKKGRDVYILGAANVGKSAFINAMLKMMADNDPIAAAARKYKPIQSAVPGTTLGPIQIDAFQGGKLFDTPGVHLHHRQSAVVHAEDLQYLAPRSRLRGVTFMVNDANEQKTDINGLSVFWGGLVRIDIQKVLPETRLTFYGPRAVQIQSTSTAEADEFYSKEVGQMLTPPTGKERAGLWGGFQTVRNLKIQFDDTRRPACDIAISGLGWIAVEPVSRSLKASDSSELQEMPSGELEFTVHVPKAVEVFIRPSLPVGAAGGEWYEYRDLTEKEEELRPKWFF